MEKITFTKELINHRESGWFNNKRYNVGYLYVWANERFPIEDLSISTLEGQVGELNFDEKSIDKIDSNKPILLAHNNHIIDGKHRLFKAVKDGNTSIKIIRLPEELPVEAEM